MDLIILAMETALQHAVSADGLLDLWVGRFPDPDPKPLHGHCPCNLCPHYGDCDPSRCSALAEHEAGVAREELWEERNR